jgi:hypothetical protein
MTKLFLGGDEGWLFVLTAERCQNMANLSYELDEHIMCVGGEKWTTLQIALILFEAYGHVLCKCIDELLSRFYFRHILVM